MNTNRLTRDEILADALDMVDTQSLDQHDRPGGSLVATAYSIRWLQRGLDLFFREFPWSGALVSTSLSITASTNSYSQPADMVMDKRDGIKIEQTDPRINKRLLRQSMDWLLSQDATSANTGEPSYYVLLGDTIKLWQWPKTTYSGILWYYKLPAALAPNERPGFPDDEVLVEYVHLRGKEWSGEKEPGTALLYAKAVISQLKKSGLGEESESDTIPLDLRRFRPSQSGWSNDGSDWLGSPVVNA
jgi:hypothetical protein